MMFACYGQILALLAALTCGLGVADVVMTSVVYCSSSNAVADYCSNTAEPYIWVWVASGIWGSIPIFLTGLYAMCVGNDPIRWRYLSLLIFLSAIVFSPVIVVLTAIELYKGSSSIYTFYTFAGGSLSPGTINSPSPNPYQAKFGIPLAVAILGGLMFLITGYMTMMLCCCMESMGVSTAQNAVVTTSDVPCTAPAPPVVIREPAYQRPAPPPCEPCNQVISTNTGPIRYNNIQPYGYAAGFTNYHSGPSNAVYYR